MDLTEQHPPEKRVRRSLEFATASTSASTLPTEDPIDKADITVRIHGISQFMDDTDAVNTSPSVTCGGIQWSVMTTPDLEDGTTQLACYIFGRAGGMWSAWLCATIRIVHPIDPRLDHVVKAEEILYGSQSLVSSWGRNVISRNGLLDAANGLVAEDALEILVRTEVNNVYGCASDMFRDPRGLAADAKIVVEGGEFFVNKGYLSVTSRAFRTMFASKPMEAGRMLEVRLMELEADEFGEFLSVTYPGRQQLTDTNVLKVFRVADYLSDKRILALCENYLKGVNGVPPLDKIIVAEELQRDDLKESVITELTKSDVQAIADDPRGLGLPQSTLVAILKRAAST